MQLWLILTIVAVIGVVYSYIKSKRQQEFAEQPVKLQEPAPKMDLTYEQLAQYTQKTSKYVFLALRGTIYDVSNTQFYKQPSGYAMFAGHDASVNLSKMSHQPQYLNKYNQIALSREQNNTLDEWVGRFQMKYPIVGKVIV